MGLPKTMRSRLALLGLGAVFAAPLVLAAVFHAGAGAWFGFAPGAANRGELLTPPRPAPAERLVLAAGARAGAAGGGRLPADFFDRRWTLVYFAAHGCGQACAAALEAMRRAHRSLGRNRYRVRRLLLLPAAVAPGPGAAAGGAGQPAARITPAWRRALLGPEAEAEAADGIWLVDPRRFVVLRFPADAGPRTIRGDLSRLLKYSKWQTG